MSGIADTMTNNLSKSYLALQQESTDRKQAENDLKKSERKFRQIAETIEDVFWMSTPGMDKMLYISPAFEKTWGRTRDSLYQNPKSFLDAVHPDDREKLVTELSRHSQGEYGPVEYRIARPDGSVRWIRDKGFPVRENGELIALTGIASDITDRKQAEEELQLFRQLVDHVNDSIFVIDLATGNFLDVNQRCCDNLQYSRAELCHMGIVDVEMTLPNDFSWQNHLRQIKDHNIHLLEGTHRRKDETTFPVEVNVNNIQIANREYMVSVARDITDRNAAEEKLFQSMRKLMEANTELKQFSYVMAHDLKAPIRAISNYSSFLQEDLAESLTGNQKKYLRRLKETALEAGSMVEDLLSLARIGRADIEKNPVDLGELVKNIISSMDLETDVQIELADDWPTIDSDAILLRQVFQNLIDNALKYNISAVKRIELVCLPTVDGGVECFVRDNGIGIGAQYHEQIFKMFERLHAPKEYSGSGVGLALVKRAVERLGGTIRLESTPGKGSTFYLSLPKTMA